MTHTPGPWGMNKQNEVVTANGANLSIALIYPSSFIDRDERDANAHLIAAAPEWMALATAYRNTHNQRGSDGPCNCRDCREFDRLIEKTGGRG